MKKYWLLVAALGAVACSGSAAEDGGSNQEAVNAGPNDDKPTSNGASTVPADGNAPADGNEAATAPVGTKDPGTTAPYDCQPDLDKLVAASQDAADLEQLALIKQKYVELQASCQPQGTTAPAGDKPDADAGTAADAPLSGPAAGNQPADGTEPTTLPYDPNEPGTEPATTKDPGTTAPYDCQADLDKLANASANATDADQLALIKGKYEMLLSVCEPPVSAGTVPDKQ